MVIQRESILRSKNRRLRAKARARKLRRTLPVSASNRQKLPVAQNVIIEEKSSQDNDTLKRILANLGSVSKPTRTTVKSKDIIIRATANGTVIVPIQKDAMDKAMSVAMANHIKRNKQNPIVSLDRIPI